MQRFGGEWNKIESEMLRYDNDGEYELSELKEFYVVNEIRMEKTIKGTLKQNGVIEWTRLDEYSRCMRLNARMLKIFGLIVFLINRGSSVSLDGGISEGAWSGRGIVNFFPKVMVVFHGFILWSDC